MAYDEDLARRIRGVLKEHPELTEKKMFGGLAFLRSGKMFCGIVRDVLMVRVGPLHYEESLEVPHVRPMDFTGRPMQGYVYVDPEGCDTAKTLGFWVGRGFDFSATLVSSDASGRKKAKSSKSAKKPRSIGNKSHGKSASAVPGASLRA